MSQAELRHGRRLMIAWLVVAVWAALYVGHPPDGATAQAGIEGSEP